jgi:hypothetical protein
MSSKRWYSFIDSWIPSVWITLSAMGGAMIIQGAVNVVVGSAPLGSAVRIFGGLLLIGSGSVGYIRSPKTLEVPGTSGLIIRAVGTVGAVIYVVITAFTLSRVIG